jgi:uncharacterized protein with HEPN domain
MRRLNMQNEDRIRLQHIIDGAYEIGDFVKGYSFEKFVNDRKTVLAVTRLIEVIGEAASKISNKFKENHKNIPWSKIIGMRNRLIHAYFDIDYQVVWQTVQENIPMLIFMIKELLEKPE